MNLESKGLHVLLYYNGRTTVHPYKSLPVSPLYITADSGTDAPSVLLI